MLNNKIPEDLIDKTNLQNTGVELIDRPLGRLSPDILYFFLQHGETEGNTLGKINKSNQESLNSLGVMQIKQRAQKILLMIGDNKDWKKNISIAFPHFIQRDIETTQILCTELGLGFPDSTLIQSLQKKDEDYMFYSMMMGILKHSDNAGFELPKMHEMLVLEGNADQQEKKYKYYETLLKKYIGGSVENIHGKTLTLQKMVLHYKDDVDTKLFDDDYEKVSMQRNQLYVSLHSQFPHLEYSRKLETRKKGDLETGGDAKDPYTYGVDARGTESGHHATLRTASAIKDTILNISQSEGFYNYTSPRIHIDVGHRTGVTGFFKTRDRDNSYTMREHKNIRTATLEVGYVGLNKEGQPEFMNETGSSYFTFDNSNYIEQCIELGNIIGCDLGLSVGESTTIVNGYLEKNIHDAQFRNQHLNPGSLLFLPAIAYALEVGSDPIELMHSILTNLTKGNELSAQHIISISRIFEKQSAALRIFYWYLLEETDFVPMSSGLSRYPKCEDELQYCVQKYNAVHDYKVRTKEYCQVYVESFGTFEINDLYVDPLAEYSDEGELLSNEYGLQHILADIESTLETSQKPILGEKNTTEDGIEMIALNFAPVNMGMGNQKTVITGGSQTGKTTLLKRVFKEQIDTPGRMPIWLDGSLLDIQKYIDGKIEDLSKIVTGDEPIDLVLCIDNYALKSDKFFDTKLTGLITQFKKVNGVNGIAVVTTEQGSEGSLISMDKLSLSSYNDGAKNALMKRLGINKYTGVYQERLNILEGFVDLTPGELLNLLKITLSGKGWRVNSAITVKQIYDLRLDTKYSSIGLTDENKNPLVSEQYAESVQSILGEYLLIQRGLHADQIISTKQGKKITDRIGLGVLPEKANPGRLLCQAASELGLIKPFDALQFDSTIHNPELEITNSFIAFGILNTYLHANDVKLDMLYAIHNFEHRYVEGWCLGEESQLPALIKKIHNLYEQEPYTDKDLEEYRVQKYLDFLGAIIRYCEKQNRDVNAYLMPDEIEKGMSVYDQQTEYIKVYLKAKSTGFKNVFVG